MTLSAIRPPALSAFTVLVTVVVTAVAPVACSGRAPSNEDARSTGASDDATLDVTFRPVPHRVDVDAREAALGRRLFFDKRLSADDTIACATCHDLANGGVDHQRTSTGIKGAVGPINAPSVFNASLGFAFFWNGRASTLEEQAGGPPLAAGEMGSTWPQIVGKLEADASVAAEFTALFPDDGVKPANITHAIATFERTLVTPGAAFDRFLEGDATALSDKARAGFELFQGLGCVACHQGQAIGGNMYQRFGVMGDYFGDRGSETDADLGRFAVTHREEDRHVFKVPSLRNVARTGPYFHDGSAPTLGAAVRVMARYQLGRTLSDDEVEKLVAFLASLTGTYEGRPL